jgi:ribonuclease P protein component
VPKPANAFPPGKRLDQHGVRAVLKSGRRVSRADVEIKFLVRPIEAAGARLAIAVAKRLVRHAVARNRIKRLVREAFRQHPVSACGQDLLVTYKSKDALRLSALRVAMRLQLDQLFSDVQQRVPRVPQAGRVA